MIYPHFAQDVEEVLGPLMHDLGFRLDEVDDCPDEGGIERHIVYYSSDKCKIQVYYSSREGEVNSMIAPPDVPNSFGLIAPKWLHITKFTKRPDLPFKELLRKAREEYASYPNPIWWVRACIERNFDAALAGVVDAAS